MEYNIYCDESCHLEHDHQKSMVTGAIWCPKNDVTKISEQIRKIKREYNANGEIKWVKVSKSRENYFIKLIDYFFAEEFLNFRALVVDDKLKLNHDYFNKGSHDSFYYKTFYYMLKNIMDYNDGQYNIYIDKKDTRSSDKIIKLKEILCNNYHDFNQSIIKNIQNINSSESQILQLADLLIGAVSYYNRGLETSNSKNNLIKRIQYYTKQSINATSPPWINKFNLLIFTPQEKA